MVTARCDDGDGAADTTSVYTPDLPGDAARLLIVSY
jgi:hypothetical protein